MRTPKQWDELFFDIAFTMAQRSKDPSTQCGAVLVNQSHEIISTGFNGPPPGIEDTLVPWNDRPQKYAYIIHAEENALLFALDRGGSTVVEHSKLYCTHYPCSECLIRLIRANVSVVKVPYDNSAYPLSKYQVNPDEILKRQLYPKLNVLLVNYRLPRPNLIESNEGTV